MMVKIYVFCIKMTFYWIIEMNLCSSTRLELYKHGHMYPVKSRLEWYLNRTLQRIMHMWSGNTARDSGCGGKWIRGSVSFWLKRDSYVGHFTITPLWIWFDGVYCHSNGCCSFLFPRPFFSGPNKANKQNLEM